MFLHTNGKFNSCKKSLKIPRGNAETINGTDNTIIKRKKDKRSSNMTLLNTRVNSCAGMVNSCCSTGGIRRVSLVTNPVIYHCEKKTGL